MNKNINYKVVKNNKDLSQTKVSIKVEWNTKKVLDYLKPIIQKELSITKKQWKKIIQNDIEKISNIINDEGTIFVNNIFQVVENPKNSMKTIQEFMRKQYANKRQMNEKAIDILYSGKEYEYMQKAKEEKLITQKRINQINENFKFNCKMFNSEIANQMRFTDLYFEVESMKKFYTEYRGEHIVKAINNITKNDIEKKIVEDRKMQLIERIKDVLEG